MVTRSMPRLFAVAYTLSGVLYDSRMKWLNGKTVALPEWVVWTWESSFTGSPAFRESAEAH